MSPLSLEMLKTGNRKFQALVLGHLVNLTQNNTEIKQDLAQVKESMIRIENNHGETPRALFATREVPLDINGLIFDTLNRIEGKVDGLTLKISARDIILKSQLT